MPGGNVLVAVLDDEPKMRWALKRLLGTHGYEVELFGNEDEFLNAARSPCPDCLLLDLHMPHTTGFDVLQSMAALQIDVPAIVITGRDDPGNAGRAFELGAAAYLLKPLDETTLIGTIERVCQISHPPAGQTP